MKLIADNVRPPHPGELLREIAIPLTGKTQTELAARLGISRRQFSEILREKREVSPTTSVRLGKLFGTGSGLWIGLQAEYDLWLAEREIDASAIQTRKVY
jgi:addiction module HigA family antidote